jgi:transglutaminase-like putative cysteine protease/lipoprotein NlpI
MQKLRCSLLAFAASGLLASGAAAQSTAAVSPVDTKILEEHVEVNDQGVATDTVHYRLRANNNAAAQQIGQQPIDYSEALSDLEVVDAYTLKADGKKLPVAPTAIYSQMPQGDSQAAMFDDLRQKVVVFPDVEAGDSIDLTFRRRDHEEIMPGQFMFDRAFSRQYEVDNAEVTIVAPKSYPLYLETHDIAFDRHDNGNQTIYHWRFSQPVPVARETTSIAVERQPRFLISSFKNYDAFASTFERLVQPELTVTPAIQTLADQITRGASDRRAKAEKIYDWVSRHVRYVGVEVGVGRVVPHSADTVLANGYGDCKDHVALFSALLKAEGIASEMVLINAGAVYYLPPTAVMGDLDHVITWLPEFGLYADTTAGVAPFGSLPFQEYGKPIVHATTAGNALRQLPVLAPGLANLSTTTVAHVDATGKVTGTSTMMATGPYSWLLRAIALGIEANGPDASAEAILKKANVEGTASFILRTPPEDIAPTYSLGSNWAFGPFPDVLRGKRFAMPEGVGVLGAPGDFLMGSLGNTKPVDGEPIACYSGHAEEDISVDAPPGYQFLSPPLDAAVRSTHIAFKTHWSITGSTLHLHRDFTSTITTPLCVGAVRLEAANTLSAIRDTYLYGAAMAPIGGKPVASAGNMRVADAAPVLGATQAGLAARVQVAQLSHTNVVASLLEPHVPSYSPEPAPRDTNNVPSGAAASETELGKQLAAHPTSAMYEQRGMLRLSHGSFDAATADFTHALSLASANEDSSRLLAERGSSFWFAHDWRPALNDYAEAVKRNPANAEAIEGLGRSELFAGRDARAAEDLAKAVSLKPDDSVAKLWLFIAESRTGKDARADLVASTINMSAAPDWSQSMVRAYRGDGANSRVLLGSPNDVSAQEFYLGELSLAKGSNDEARKHFQASRAAGTNTVSEFVAAGIELEHLK